MKLLTLYAIPKYSDTQRQKNYFFLRETCYSPLARLLASHSAYQKSSRMSRTFRQLTCLRVFGEYTFWILEIKNESKAVKTFNRSICQLKNKY